MMLKVYVREFLQSTVEMLFVLILSGLLLAMANIDIIKIISLASQILMILFCHILHYSLIVLLNIYRHNMRASIVITCTSLVISLTMILYLSTVIDLPIRNEETVMSMVWMLPVIYSLHMFGRLMLELMSLVAASVQRVSDALFMNRRHFYRLISVLPISFILFPINGYSLLSGESYILVKPVDGLLLNSVWLLYCIYYLMRICLGLSKRWSGPKVKFKRDHSQLVIVEHVMTPIMEKMVRKLDSLDEYRSQLKNITGTYPEIQLISVSQYARNRQKIEKDAINNIHLFLFHITDLALISDQMVERYMVTYGQELSIKGRKVIVALVCDLDTETMNDRKKQLLDRIQGSYNRALIGDVKSLQKKIKEEAYSLIVAESLKQKVVSHLNRLDLEVLNHTDDLIASEFLRLVNHIKTSSSVIDDFYRIIRLFDYIIHIQAFHDVCHDMDDLSFEEMTRELSFPASGKWIIKWNNEFKPDQTHIWKQPLSKGAKTYIRDVCKMVGISFNAKKPKWVFALENGIVGLRNKTIGHGIVTYELCDSALLKLLNIQYEYVMCHMEHSKMIRDARIMKVIGGNTYVLTGYSYGSKEYMDYSTGDLYREKKLTLKTCEVER